MTSMTPTTQSTWALKPKQKQEAAGTISLSRMMFSSSGTKPNSKTLPKLREYRYLTLDIHGDPPLNGSEEPSGEVCVAASDEPEKFVSLPPRDLNLRSGKTELLVVASCHQREVMLNCAVPRGCRVISYSNVLKEGSVNGLVRHASHAKDFLDIELSMAAVDEISRRVKGLSRNSKTLEDWLMFESEWDC